MNEILKEISKWKLDAKQEESSRYFYNLDFVEDILSGEKSYIIGRKGTGKTAIGQYLESTSSYNIFTRKLTFKNFPFNDLYSLNNKSFPSPNQYITLWKYLIYTTIVKQMMINNNIDEEISSKLRNIYQDDPEASLSRSIKKWVNVKFDFNILGNGLGISADKESTYTETSWIEKVEILEDLIYKYIDDSKYIIVFDELDEDYTDIIKQEKYDEYTSLMTGLFKAVEDIKSIFDKEQFNIHPVVFLRDDIYAILQDPDKNKWSDSLIWIEWSKSDIQKLIAFRISKAIDPKGKVLDFNEAWNKIFYKEAVTMGDRQQRKVSQYDYIERNTMMRPRDFIKYLQLCSVEAEKKSAQFIKSKTIKFTSRSFSNYLRGELVDEIHSIVPDISKVIDVFSHIRQQAMKIETFQEVYLEEYNQKFLKNSDVDFILKVLFNFSAIGNQPSQHNTQIFKYQNKEASLNFKEKIVVHRGLFKALQIV